MNDTIHKTAIQLLHATKGILDESTNRDNAASDRIAALHEAIVGFEFLNKHWEALNRFDEIAITKG